jgi:hypothetical protein
MWNTHNVEFRLRLLRQIHPIEERDHVASPIHECQAQRRSAAAPQRRSAAAPQRRAFSDSNSITRLNCPNSPPLSGWRERALFILVAGAVESARRISIKVEGKGSVHA